MIDDLPHPVFSDFNPIKIRYLFNQAAPNARTACAGSRSAE